MTRKDRRNKVIEKEVQREMQKVKKQETKTSKKQAQARKQRKTPPTIKVGTHKKLTIALWVLLISSVSFGVYKNFTAIDIHTIHEREVVEQRIVDTNRVESFVEAFAIEYFAWGQSQDAIDTRNERLKGYLTEELSQLNFDMIRADIPTSSHVQNVQMWNVTQNNDMTFTVTFSVEQQITESETSTTITGAYHVVVHVDENENMVIIKNPTMDRKPQKSDYQPKQIESDGTVDAVTSEEITSFLETFFKLYPTATEKELAYYVSDNVLPVVQKNYVFAELVNPVYIMEDDYVNVIVGVKYLDQDTKTVQVSQYELRVVKEGNWFVSN